MLLHLYLFIWSKGFSKAYKCKTNMLLFGEETEIEGKVQTQCGVNSNQTQIIGTS